MARSKHHKKNMSSSKWRKRSNLLKEMRRYQIGGRLEHKRLPQHLYNHPLIRKAVLAGIEDEQFTGKE